MKTLYINILLFVNIVSDPNHKLKALLPPDHDNLTCQSFEGTQQEVLLYMRCRNSPGYIFIPLIFMLYISTYFNMNML